MRLETGMLFYKPLVSSLHDLPVSLRARGPSGSETSGSGDLKGRRLR